MKAHHVVFLMATAIAILVIALFLIVIVVELRKTYMKLIVILGAVQETADQTDGLDAVVATLADDIAAGSAALEGGVQRLEQRLGDADEQPSAPPNVYS